MISKIVNIKDVCSEIFAGGDAPKSKMALQPTAEYTIPIYSNGEENSGLYGYTDNPRVTAPSITISARGTIGYTAIRTQPFVPIVRLITLTPIPDIIDIQYLYYAVKKYNFAGSGTSIPQLTVPMIKDYNFPLPPMEEQRRIASLLDKVSDLIAKRRAQLDKLDLLVKARFVEMFGDPVVNPMGWEKRTLKEVCTKLTDGTHFSPESFGTGDFKYITAKNIKENGFDFSAITYVSEKVHRPIFERCNPEFGDILYIKDGVTTGVAMINTLKEEFSLLSSVALLKQNRSIIDGYFLCGVLNNKEMYTDIRSNMGGAAITRLTIAKLNKIQIILPPVELQKYFASYAQQIEKIKTTVNCSLDKLEILKKALMQQHFGQ